MRRAQALLAVFVLALFPALAVAGGAQAVDSPKPVIGVAAIRANQAGGHSGIWFESGSGNPTATNITLKGLIKWAYDVEDYQISGGPKWLDSAAFDITAKLDRKVSLTGDPVQRNYFREMIQPFLADRFRLILHRTTKEISVYALVTSKDGPKLKESPSTLDPRDMRMTGGSGLLVGHGIPISILTEALRSIVGRPVADETQLTGRYDFRLQWNPADTALQPDDSGSTEPSFFTALQEQLGLRLVSRKGFAEILVIDRAEMPTEN